MGDDDVTRMYVELGVSSMYLEKREMRERLKKVAIWKELPFKDLQQDCRDRYINANVSGEDERHVLIVRLAKAMWPPKEPPTPPRPPPPRPPPPPRAPVSPGMRLAPFFQVLQLPPTATFEEVKKAFRKLALKHHPDKNQGNAKATQAFRTLAEAYEKLSEHFQTKKK